MTETRGSDTRTAIMDAAEGLILSRGYGGTSVDAILRETNVTKGAFFHHFKTKRDLAFAIVERYAALDRALLEELLGRAEKLSRDPLQQVLILIALYQEQMEELEAPPAGCLFASYAYEAGLFDQKTNDVVAAAHATWQGIVAGRIQKAMDEHRTRIEVSADDLAMHALTVFEGGLILAKTLKDAGLMARQLQQFRNYLELLFEVV